MKSCLIAVVCVIAAFTGSNALMSEEKQKAADEAQFDFAPGDYEPGKPQTDALEAALEKSSVIVNLSWHAGISLPSETGKGWDNKLSIGQLKARLEKIKDKRQAKILEEKNYTGEGQEEEKVIKVMKELGFKTIIVQVCHSRFIVIDNVIKN